MTTPISAEKDAPELACPICGADLYLTVTSAIPLYRVDPPWPGAGEATYGPEDAVSQGWEVECVEGHTVWTHVDQIRADNAAGLTDDDETGDYAPTFRPEAWAVIASADPEPQPSDGPEYRAELQFWKERQTNRTHPPVTRPIAPDEGRA